jgi:hypothetical protein
MYFDWLKVAEAAALDGAAIVAVRQEGRAIQREADGDVKAGLLTSGDHTVISDYVSLVLKKA